MEQGIHYRIGGKLTHAGCEMLPGGKDIPYIIISSIELKEEEMINGRTERNVWVAHFAKDNGYTTLPMILNVTNRKRIAKLYPQVSGCINLLKDIPVCLTKESCRDIQDGGETWGLRISKKRPVAPAGQVSSKPAFKDEDWEKAVAFIKGGGTVEQIASKYTLTKEQREDLISVSVTEEA